jgi:hypothetical protein
MRSDLIGASILAFVLGIAAGCGETDKTPAKPPPTDTKGMQLKQQEDMKKQMKGAGLDKEKSDKDKGDKEDKK